MNSNVQACKLNNWNYNLGQTGKPHSFCLYQKPKAPPPFYGNALSLKVLFVIAFYKKTMK